MSPCRLVLASSVWLHVVSGASLLGTSLLRGSHSLIVNEEPFHAEHIGNDEKADKPSDSHHTARGALNSAWLWLAQQKASSTRWSALLFSLPVPAEGVVGMVGNVAKLDPDKPAPHIVIKDEGAVTVSSKPPTLFERFLMWIMSVMSILIWIGLAVAAAHYYRNHKKEVLVVGDGGAANQDEPAPLTEFHYGVFDCFSRVDICLWAFCCPAVRWADNINTVGLLGFWIGFSLFLGLFVLGSETQDLFAYIVLAIVGAFFRQELRAKFNMTKTGGITYLEDCMLYFCCMWCTITQEARQVEEAVRRGHPAVVTEKTAS